MCAELPLDVVIARQGPRSIPELRAIFGPLLNAADALAKRLALLTLLAVAGSSILAAIVPLIFKATIDRFESIGENKQYVGVIILIGAYAIGHWVTRSLVELRSLLFGRTEQRLFKRLGSNVFRHVIRLPLRFHLDAKTGALTQALTNGLLGYRLVLYHILLTVLPAIIELATMTTVLVFLNQGAYVLVILFAMLLHAAALRAGMTNIRDSAWAASAAHIDAIATLTDSTLNCETIKYFTAESDATARFNAALDKAEQRWKDLLQCKSESGLVIAAILALCLGISLYIAVRQVRDGLMSVGEFVLIHAYILQIAQPLDSTSVALRDMAQGRAFIAKLLELLESEEEKRIPARVRALPLGPAGLALHSVSYSYEPGRQILSDIDFAVPAGKKVAIVGASGSGKSSIIRLLLRLIHPTHGQIYLGGVPLWDIPLDMLRRAIAVIPQDVALFDDSIAYNIGIGMQGSTTSDIVEAAKVADIHDFILGLPSGYQTLVGERGVKLSGGEKQRLAIARAAIRSPKVYVLDEATSSLDAQMEQRIHDNLMQVAQNLTMLIIAHRLSTVTFSDEILLLSQGRIVERGSHCELLGRKGAYSELWRAQYGQTEVARQSVLTLGSA